MELWLWSNPQFLYVEVKIFAFKLEAHFFKFLKKEK